jgi:signal transduction histidine kinase
MVRKLFLVAAVLALAANFYSDFSILQMSKASSESGKWIIHSYDVNRAIDSARIRVLQSQVKPFSKTKAKLKFESLEVLVKDIPSQKKRVAQLNELSSQKLTAVTSEQALALLSQMASEEEALLISRIKADDEINLMAKKQVLAGNAIDFVMVLLSLGFFLYEYSTHFKLRNYLAQTLKKMNEGNLHLAEKLSSRDAKFKSVVHDLKNPLGVIRGFAEMLHENSPDKGSVNQMAMIIQRVSNDTLKLVGTVLETTVDHQFEIEPFDFYQALSETCTFLEPIADEKKQKILLQKKGSGFLVHSDKQKTQNIFYNLIGNALKFSPSGTFVSVECQNCGDVIELIVKDQGPGFGKGDFANLYIPGKKLSAKPTGNEVSTGFGLYSAKETVMNLGGKIQIANNPDKGACVKITLPVADFDLRTEEKNSLSRH